jgi:DNA-directed RNA polymerase I, II, and III subunit RPABC2
MTKYEMTRIISTRAIQITQGSGVNVDAGDVSEPLELAEMELRQKKFPDYLTIERPLPDGTIEVWTVNELINPWEVRTMPN